MSDEVLSYQQTIERRLELKQDHENRRRIRRQRRLIEELEHLERLAECGVCLTIGDNAAKCSVEIRPDREPRGEGFLAEAVKASIAPHVLKAIDEAIKLVRNEIGEDV